MTFGDLNINLSENFTNTFVMISDELSNKLFRFSPHCLGAELVEGGGVKHPHPPPQHVVENPHSQ